jgi:hypothetical protein
LQKSASINPEQYVEQLQKKQLVMNRPLVATTLLSVGATSRAFSRMGGFTARNPGLVGRIQQLGLQLLRQLIPCAFSRLTTLPGLLLWSFDCCLDALLALFLLHRSSGLCCFSRSL